MRIGYVMTVQPSPGQGNAQSDGDKTDSDAYDAQIDALKEARCERIYTDALPATNSREKRLGLTMALEFASAGDAIVVCALDRLGPTRGDALEVLAALHAKGAHLISLRDGFEFSGTGEAASIRNFQVLASLHTLAPAESAAES